MNGVDQPVGGGRPLQRGTALEQKREHLPLSKTLERRSEVPFFYRLELGPGPLQVSTAIAIPGQVRAS